MAEKYGNVKDLTFPQKIEHYWHYYWKLGAGIAVVLAVVIAGVVSTLANPHYDTSFLLVTRGKALRSTVTPIVLELEREVEKYAVDTDGNGEVNVLADCIPFPVGTEDTASDNETAMQTRLAGELQLGDSQLMIFDRAMYDNLVSLEGFVDLRELFPDRDIPMIYAIPLSETVLSQTVAPIPEEGLAKGQTLARYNADNKAILDDLYICFRRDDGLKPDRRAVQLELLKAIVNAG